MDLVVDKLAVTRGGLRVLEGVAFRLAPGAALVLRGPNGVGKTTLLRCIAGLQRPEAGRVEGAGERVAYAGHADGLKAMLTVRENLDFWAGIYGGGDVPAAFAAYELGGLEDRLAQTLSAGQKRRLGLARLLVTGRPLWLMDEPTVSLDAASVALFARAVKAHLAAGGAALIATHAALGLEADILELDRFRARADAGRGGAFDEAFA